MRIRDRVVELRRIPAGSLLPNPKNWRRHPKAQADALRGLLSEIGYADALLARETPEGLMIIDGHLRAETTPDTVVPVLVLDVTEAEADKLLLSLDPLAAMAEGDTDALRALLEQVETDSDAVQKMLDGLAKEYGAQPGPKPLDDPGPRFDEAEELRKKWGVELGQLWVLGEHRLLCGDSTNPADVSEAHERRACRPLRDRPAVPRRVRRDESPRNQGKREALLAQHRLVGHLRTGVGRGGRGAELRPLRPLHQGCSRGRDSPQRRLVLLACLATAADGRGELGEERGIRPPADHLEQAEQADPHALLVPVGARALLLRLAEGKEAAEGDRRLRAHGLGDRRGLNDDERPDHPTPKPLDCFAIPMRQHTKVGDVCYEPFSGSGSQIIAGEREGRRVYAIEISPAYVAVTLERWAEATGGKPQSNQTPARTAKVRVMARPTLLTPERHKAIVAAIRAGAFDWIAAEANGIDRQTFKLWMRKGMRKKREPYLSFVHDVRTARAQARLSAEIEVRKEQPFSWLRFGPAASVTGKKAGRSRPRSSTPDPFGVMYSQEWTIISVAIETALESYPEAKLAVAEALKRLA